MEKEFIERQYRRIQRRIAKYKDPGRIRDELLSGDVSPYTKYKQQILIPILEKTLRKIEQGKYGICEKCGKPIERKRLELVPAAELCLSCINENAGFGVVIPAAGSSGRMGFPKLFLPFDEKENFLQHITGVYNKNSANSIVVVVNKDDFARIDASEYPANVHFTVNKTPEKGRFYSLMLGVSELKEKNQVFIQNVDNPFIDKDLIRRLLKGIANHDFCVPVYDKKPGHPVLINRRVMNEIVNTGNPETQNLRLLLKHCDRGEVQVKTADIHANINTRDDYIRYGFNPGLLPSVF